MRQSLLKPTIIRSFTLFSVCTIHNFNTESLHNHKTMQVGLASQATALPQVASDQPLLTCAVTSLSSRLDSPLATCTGAIPAPTTCCCCPLTAACCCAAGGTSAPPLVNNARCLVMGPNSGSADPGRGAAAGDAAAEVCLALRQRRGLPFLLAAASLGGGWA